MKKLVRLTESDLHKIVNELVKKKGTIYLLTPDYIIQSAWAVFFCIY